MKKAKYPHDILQMIFYDLLRDCIPAGELERIIKEHEKIQIPMDVIYSNNHLAKYAAELSKRLRLLLEKENAGARKNKK